MSYLEASKTLLKIISQRIQKKIRLEDTLSRIGGDEFTVIMEKITKIEDALLLAQKITDVLTEPISFKENILNISASIGIRICPDDSSDTDTLLIYADTAMYTAKKRGRNRVMFYSQEDEI